MTNISLERLTNLGYLGLIKEASNGVALTPTDFIPLYDETLNTNMNFVDQQPISGVRSLTYTTIQGLRDHKGDITVMAEPNTTARLFDMMLYKTSTANMYTFTITSHSASIGATYTNNGITFTVLAAIINGTTLICSGSGAPTASGSLVYVSGTPIGDITFSASVAGPYIHTFDHSNESNSYTLDISTGNIVSRYFGVRANKITPVWNKTEMRWKVSVSALGSFSGRALASAPTGTNPYTIVLDTSYDPSPTTGLVAGDLIRFFHTGSAYIDCTVATIINSTSFTTTTDVTSMTTGDMVYLRPATVSFTMQPTFIWPKTQICFGATATAALAATQTRVETGSTFEIMYDFNKDTGEDRSGGFDPAALVHTTADATFSIKKYFDQPDDIAKWNALTKSAAVIRLLSGSTNQYECRVTLNNIKTDGVVTPDIKPKQIAYSELKYKINYDISDAQSYDIIVINALATI